MDLAQQIILLINGLCLVIILFLAGIVIRAGVKYNFNVGDPTVQTPLRWRIWRCLIIIMFIALIMAIINLASPYL